MIFNKQRIDNIKKLLNQYSPEKSAEIYYQNEIKALLNDMEEMIDVIEFYANTESYKQYEVNVQKNGFNYTTSLIDEDSGYKASKILEEFYGESFNK